MSAARHPEDGRAKECDIDNLSSNAKVYESVGNTVVGLGEDDHAEVRAIVDSGLAQLKEWMDLRLRQQEDTLRSLLTVQEHQRSQGSVKMEPQVTSQEQAPEQHHVPPPQFAPEQLSSSSVEARPRQSISKLANKTQGSTFGDLARIQSAAQPRAAVSHLKSTTTVSSTVPEQFWISSLMGIFDQLDLKGTGCIDLAEIKMAFQETGFSEMQALEVFSSMDRTDNGTIDRLEWLHLVTQSTKGSDDEMKLMKEFLSRLVKLQRVHGSIYQASKARRARVILRHDSIARAIWDVMLVSLLVYVAVALPYSLGFGSNKTLDDLDLAVDIFFCCDVVLNFRTSYLDEDDTVVVDWKKIGKRYLQSWFFLDLIASVPCEQISAGLVPDLTAARLVKIGRIMRVLKMLRFTKIMSIRADSESLELLKIQLTGRPLMRLARTLKLLLIAFLVCHWLACFIAFVDSTAFDEYFSSLGQAPAALQKYLAGMYWAMTTVSTVGYGDITPVTDQERAFSMFAMVIGGTLYGYIIGSVTSIVTDMDVYAFAYQERMEIIQSWLDRNTQIPLLLRRRLRKNFKRAYEAKAVISDNEVVDQLSGELRGDAAFYLIHSAVRHHPMVMDLSNSALAELVYVMQETHAKAHEFIVQIDAPGIGMYFLVEGLARYDEGLKWKPPGAEDTGKPGRFQHIMIGDSFGEEIIFGLAETFAYTVVTITDCKFKWIDETLFKEHFKNLPDLHAQMYAAVIHPQPQVGHAEAISSNKSGFQEYAI